VSDDRPALTRENAIVLRDGLREVESKWHRFLRATDDQAEKRLEELLDEAETLKDALDDGDE
jgi:hypothetical protein